MYLTKFIFFFFFSCRICTEYYVLQHCSRNFFFWHKNTENTGRKVRHPLTFPFQRTIWAAVTKITRGFEAQLDATTNIFAFRGGHAYFPQQYLSESLPTNTGTDEHHYLGDQLNQQESRKADENRGAQRHVWLVWGSTAGTFQFYAA